MGYLPARWIAISAPASPAGGSDGFILSGFTVNGFQLLLKGSLLTIRVRFRGLPALGASIYNCIVFNNMIKSLKVKPEVLFYVFIIVCLAAIIYFRFLESVSRFFGYDEYYNLHLSYLMSIGKVPYRDFFNIYSPFFHLSFVPIFKILGEKFLVLTVGRLLVLFYFLIGVLFTYRTARLFVSNTASVFITLITLSLPIAVEKTIDIRPDNLMVSLFLAGLFYSVKGIIQKKQRDLFIGGIILGFSALVMIKIIFSLAGLILGIITFIILAGEKKNRMRDLIIPLFSGIVVIFLLFCLIILYFDIFKQALISMLIYPGQIGAVMRFSTGLYPTYWFLPNNAVYGTFKGIPWWTNSIFTVLFLCGIVTTVIRIVLLSKNRERLMLLFPLITSFVSLYFVPRVFQQYLLPFLSLCVFFVAFVLEDTLKLVKREKIKSKILVYTYTALSMLLVLSMKESWKVKKTWTNIPDRQWINYVTIKTKPTDIFWGGSGIYIFRDDGYYIPHFSYFEFPNSIIKESPPLIPMLEARKIKYLYISKESINKRQWPLDSRQTDDFIAWVKNNFVATDHPFLMVRKAQ
ncbi:hypothetical protein A2Y99_01025 [Candidatus Gottesmanbacteria bacterium RBG_13_37_7]|uniref:Glycosyltransferase RgtA/B/C/D-like domain-containing protein n=1 Tax=Candidatus Gottesmanbacteria bacterium RBG_13_37_7 TaxID=1798369 RepID=A0A1F5YKA5_9BACT|nr:MAG: hypothetical protein A2Y99_01025 [Candidatus Gottesmanbacteria bacterium RBG_13_37_7]